MTKQYTFPLYLSVTASSSFFGSIFGGLGVHTVCANMYDCVHDHYRSKRLEHLLIQWFFFIFTIFYIPGDYLMKLVERMPSVCKASSRQRVATLRNLKYILICLILFWLLLDSMCYFIVLMSSLLFYNVKNSTNKEKLQWEGVLKIFWPAVYIVCRVFTQVCVFPAASLLWDWWSCPTGADMSQVTANQMAAPPYFLLCLGRHSQSAPQYSRSVPKSGSANIPLPATRGRRWECRMFTLPETRRGHRSAVRTHPYPQIRLP